MFTFDFKLEEGDKNVGTVYLPNKNDKNLPVIIYCHGWGGKRQLWTPTEKLCETAIGNNIALVTFDFFGCGDTGGDYRYMTYRRWKENLSAVLDFVCKQSFADEDKIGCYSFSSGSTAALRLAAEGNRIAFVISVGTCISAHIGMNGGGPAKLFINNIESLLSGGTANIFGTDFPIDFFIDTVNNAPIQTIKKIKCPILFLQGTADNPYRKADAKMGFELMNRENLSATHIEIDGGTHELDNVTNEAMKIVFDWLLPLIK
jgi:dipeptidyl aminopeptidase/acylaminoacyl peptidase